MKYLVAFAVLLCTFSAFAESLQAINDTHKAQQFVTALKASADELYQNLSFSADDEQLLFYDQQTSSVYKVFSYELQGDKAHYFSLVSLEPCLEPPCEQQTLGIFKVSEEGCLLGSYALK